MSAKTAKLYRKLGAQLGVPPREFEKASRGQSAIAKGRAHDLMTIVLRKLHEKRCQAVIEAAFKRRGMEEDGDGSR